MMTSTQKIWNICQVIFESYIIPIVYIDSYHDLVFDLPISNGTKSFHRMKLASFLSPKRETPILVMTHHSELFLVQPILGVDSPNGVLLLGPTLPFKLREEQLKGLINDSADLRDKQGALQDLQNMTVLNQDQLTSLGLLLHYMIYEERLNREVIGLLKIQPPKEKEVEKQDTLLSQNRQSEHFHHDPSFDQHFFDSIEKGDKEAFLYWQNKIPEEELGMLSRTSFLRSKKNLAISAIAVATRSAIKGGLHAEAAFTLSDLYIQRIEDTYQPENVDALFKEGMLTFIDQVNHTREQHYSKPIAKCLNFIYKHVYQPITLKDLVKQVNLHPSYLSELFKKEVGITIRDYVHQAKIEEAISLISFSDYTLTEISNLLNFTDQSHFTRVFKKITGTTPKQYQLKGGLTP
ncbi:AraC family transcriptional regulator [Pullulanibacillus sp. KACC 23026]|uniref:AraC family transcriptional regulator n=1 Tax=Pullulanibacillus sp. KACC 23026 TaxID=3028315 RepID=UPI0023B0C948|nr:AraC family transcriptional regulator [Pullulanibacillus sp. KACC 23026]WEG13543.1 AraC family transcriptional regulator [Pullulanibacillus sp. KACC 23026]